jgi:hypothetical protein
VESLFQQTSCWIILSYFYIFPECDPSTRGCVPGKQMGDCKHCCMPRRSCVQMIDCINLCLTVLCRVNANFAKFITLHFQPNLPLHILPYSRASPLTVGTLPIARGPYSPYTSESYEGLYISVVDRCNRALWNRVPLLLHLERAREQIQLRARYLPHSVLAQDQKDWNVGSNIDLIT